MSSSLLPIRRKATFDLGNPKGLAACLANQALLLANEPGPMGRRSLRVAMDS